MSTTDIDKVVNRIREIIAEDLDIHLTDAHAPFTQVESFDSLDKLEFIMHVEDEYNLEIPDEDADTLLTLQDTAEYVVRRLANK